MSIKGPKSSAPRGATFKTHKKVKTSSENTSATKGPKVENAPKKKATFFENIRTVGVALEFQTWSAIASVAGANATKKNAIHDVGALSKNPMELMIQERTSKADADAFVVTSMNDDGTYVGHAGKATPKNVADARDALIGKQSENFFKETIELIIAEPAFAERSCNEQMMVLGFVESLSDIGSFRVMGTLENEASNIASISEERIAQLTADSTQPSIYDSLSHLLEKANNGSQRAFTIYASLIEDSLLDVLKPDNVRQSNRGTCTVTSMQYWMAEHNPQRYLNTIVQMTDFGPDAEADSTVTLSHGQSATLKAEDAWFDDSQRTLSQQIFQTLAMDLANGPIFEYRNDGDHHVVPALDPVYEALSLKQSGRSGLMNFQSASVFEMLSGIPMLALRGSELTDFLVEHSPKNTFVSLSWESGGHMLHFERAEKDAAGESWIYLYNPWGEGESLGGNVPREHSGLDEGRGHIRMKEADFRKHLTGIVTPQEGIELVKDTNEFFDDKRTTKDAGEKLTHASQK